MPSHHSLPRLHDVFSSAQQSDAKSDAVASLANSLPLHIIPGRHTREDLAAIADIEGFVTSVVQLGTHREIPVLLGLFVGS